MSQIIGKINYPAESAGLAVEYSTLFSAGAENILTFRLINRGSKAVNAYRIEVVCNGEEQKYCIARKNVEISNGGTSEELEFRLSNNVEEGRIVISTVIYDDLSHEELAATVPFASFKVISRVADAILSKVRPKPDALAAACESCAEQGEEKASEQAAEQASEADVSQQTEEDTKKKRRPSHRWPLNLAIRAAVSVPLVRLFTIGVVNAFGSAPWIIMVTNVIVEPLPLVLALAALTVRDLNPKRKKATCIISVCAATLSLVLILVPMFFLGGVDMVSIAAVVIGIIFGIIAIVHKDKKLIIAIFSSTAVFAIACGLGLFFLMRQSSPLSAEEYVAFANSIAFLA